MLSLPFEVRDVEMKAEKRRVIEIIGSKRYRDRSSSRDRDGKGLIGLYEETQQENQELSMKACKQFK